MLTIQVNSEIALKQIELSDAKDIFETLNSQREHFGKWLPFVEHTQRVEDTEGFIKAMLSLPEEKRELTFTIQYNGKFVGLAGFRDTDKANLKTEIGYWLSEHYQKRGIVTQSVAALCRLVFDEIGLNRIQIRCATGNIASKNIPKRLGFTLEGVERDGELLTGGLFTDLEVYSLLKRESMRQFDNAAMRQ